jgi:hypothetical protein
VAAERNVDTKRKRHQAARDSGLICD